MTSHSLRINVSSLTVASSFDTTLSIGVLKLPQTKLHVHVIFGVALMASQGPWVLTAFQLKSGYRPISRLTQCCTQLKPKTFYSRNFQGTGKICSQYQGFVMSRLFFTYFTINGVKKIIGYTEAIVMYRFIISRLHRTNEPPCVTNSCK